MEEQDCKDCLEHLKTELSLSAQENELIDSCIRAVISECGVDIPFGLAEIMALHELAEDHPSHHKQIVSCANYLCESLDYEGNIPPEVDEKFNEMREELNKILSFSELINLSETL